MDRNGEHGLKVEKIGPTFSSFNDTPTIKQQYLSDVAPFNISDYFTFSCQVHFGPLLCHVTHDDFSSLILPAVQKALLRNPEVVLESKNEWF